jgi:pyruvate dehydrogenase E1 component beta subunit
MPPVKYYVAIGQALAEELRSDPAVILLGEDIGRPGGIYAETRGLQEEFGAHRVIDTPAGELGFLGAAVGCALTGLRPVVEISFADFFAVCMDQVVNQAAKIRYMSGGQASVPLTILTFGGAGLNAGPQHSGSYEAWLGSLPGFKVVMPTTPGDVRGLVRTAVRDDDPVVVILHKGMLQAREELPEDEGPAVPLGQAAVRREGDDVTVVAWSGSVSPALAAAEELAGRGIGLEVIDLRSIQPLDLDTVLDSVEKTHRVLVVQETVGFSGIGAELAASITREAFDFLDAPVERLAAPFTPVPFSPPLERFHLPQPADVVEAVERLVPA